MLNKQNNSGDNENHLHYCSRNTLRMKLNRVRNNKSSFTSFGNLNVGRMLSKMNFVRINWTDHVKNKKVLRTTQSRKKETSFTYYKKEGKLNWSHLTYKLSLKIRY